MEKQGWIAGTAHPTNWSQNESVIWKSTIPGAGLSSPVVVGNQVFVTTAYESRKAGFWRNVAALLKYLLAVTATLVAVPFLSDGPYPSVDRMSSRRALLSRWAFLVLWGAIVVLCFFGEGLFDYERCRVRAWLASSCIVSLSLALSFWVFPKKAPGRLGIGLIAISFGAFVVLGIPSKEHALRGGIFSANSSVVILAGGLPFVLGLLLLGSYLLGENRPRAAVVVKQLVCGQVVKYLALATPALLLVFVLANLMMKAIAEDPLQPSQQPANAEKLLHWWAFGLCGLITAGAAVASWCFGHNRFVRLALLFSLASLALASGLKLFEVAVSRFPYFTYHWGTPHWEPALGWVTIVLGSGVILAGCIFRLQHPSQVLLGQHPNLPKGFTLAVALLSVTSFADSNYLKSNSEYTRAIVCLDRETGKKQWTCESLAGPQSALDRRNSPATPTPIVHGNRIFAYFGTAGLMSCDFQGKLLWTCRSLPYSSVYGAASSPVASDGILILACDMPQGDSEVWGLDAASGHVAWSLALENDGNISGNSRTPLIKRFDGQTVAVIWRGGELLALDIQSGGIRWRCPVKTSGDVVTSAVADEEALYLTHKAGTLAVNMNRITAGLDPILWRNAKPGSNCSSPVLVHGMLFLVGEYGEAACIEAETGQTLWRERLPGQYRASVLADDRHVYFCNTKGVTTVVACDRLFRKVATNDLDEPVNASFAAADSDFYVRTEKSLYRIGSPNKDSLNTSLHPKR